MTTFSFDDLMTRAKADPDVLGIVLTGSKGREGMATQHSDYDICLVVADGVRPDWQPVHSPALDLWWTPLSKFRAYALPGEPEEWDRPAFVHIQVLFDRLGGGIAEIVQRKATLTPTESRDLTAAAIGAYVNCAYRAAKNRRDGRSLAAHLDAADSLQHALTVIFALHQRVRPFNKFLEWELRRYPLPTPEWQADKLLPQLENILCHDDRQAQQHLFDTIEEVMRRAGWFDPVQDDWGPDLDLLRSPGRT